MKPAKLFAIAVCLTLLTGCADNASSNSEEGWHCEEILYNQHASDLQITDTEQAHKELDPLREKPLALSDEMLLSGFFSKDVYITEEDASDYSDDALKDKHYADAEYGDVWYFTLHDPEKYLTLSDYMMPDYIRVAYAPKGSIIVNERACIIISLSYTDDGGKLTEAFAFTWFNGPDTTDGWNYNTK